VLDAFKLCSIVNQLRSMIKLNRFTLLDAYKARVIVLRADVLDCA
jgi:hypothetical protein